MTIYPQLDIPETLAAGPGPGNTDPRVLERFAKTGVADHMQKDVLRGMLEAKEMLRELWGTKNVYTYGVAGTGFSGLDCVLSLILPGDKVVAFPNGTFSGIDSLTIRMKASTAEELAADSLNPKPKSVIVVETPHGQSVTGETVDKALAEHKPMWAFMAHWETGSGRINDLKGFSDACLKHGVMGIVDAVSSLGVADFNIDDYPGVVAWASCPQKGVLSLPLTYAPVSFTDKAIEMVRKRGCRTYVHHPILDARHWGIIDGKDTPTPGYHQTHSCYAVAAFHEALAHHSRLWAPPQGVRLRLSREGAAPGGRGHGLRRHLQHDEPHRAQPARQAQGQGEGAGAGCPRAGLRHLADAVRAGAGAHRHSQSAFALSRSARSPSRFADAMLAMGAEFDKQKVMNGLKSYYAKAA